jgi:methionine sulfoxide reductase heme-binding subunit
MRRTIKLLIIVAALVPTAWLAWGLWTANLGVNPAETIQLQTGRWALKFLLITLAVTPIRRLTGWNAVIKYRRMLGLFAFYYASLHFLSYIVLDQYFDWRGMLADIGKRPFITVGFTAFVLMVPLAVTSTKGWIRRLGRNWQTLHRLVYLSAICAGVHFIWKVKVVSGAPVWYGLAIGGLLGFRVVWQWRRIARRSESANARMPLPDSAVSRR